MRALLLSAFTLVCLGLFPGNSQAVAFWGVGDLPGSGFFSNVTGVSSNGVAVGYSTSYYGTEAFRWQNGSLQRLPDLPQNKYGGYNSRATGLSDDGRFIVGHSKTGGVFWDNLAPRYMDTYPEDVSKDGMSVGANNGSTAFIVTNGVNTKIQPLGWPYATTQVNDISSNGKVVVGQSDGKAFRWENGVTSYLGQLPASHAGSGAAATSANGNVIVGQSAWGPMYYQAFRWENGVMSGLGFLNGANYSDATDVSGDGKVIVGNSSATSSSDAAYWWTKETGMRSVKAYLQQAGLKLDGWKLYYAAAVSSNGRYIAGTGLNPQGLSEGWVADMGPNFHPTPIPSAVWLLAAGLACLVRFKGKRV